MQFHKTLVGIHPSGKYEDIESLIEEIYTFKKAIHELNGAFSDDAEKAIASAKKAIASAKKLLTQLNQLACFKDSKIKFAIMQNGKSNELFLVAYGDGMQQTQSIPLASLHAITAFPQVIQGDLSHQAVDEDVNKAIMTFAKEALNDQVNLTGQIDKLVAALEKAGVRDEQVLMFDAATNTTTNGKWYAVDPDLAETVAHRFASIGDAREALHKNFQLTSTSESYHLTLAELRKKSTLLNTQATRSQFSPLIKDVVKDNSQQGLNQLIAGLGELAMSENDILLVRYAGKSNEQWELVDKNQVKQYPKLAVMAREARTQLIKKNYPLANNTQFVSLAVLLNNSDKVRQEETQKALFPLLA